MRDEEFGVTEDRTLMLRHAGADDGPVLVYLHGSPSSRLDVDALDQEARARGVRVVGVDRPGYGGSTYVPFSFESVAEDVVAVADHLGVDRVSVLGQSSGAAYALGVAALRPHRIGGVVAAGGGPPFFPDQPWWSVLSADEQRGVSLIGVDDVEAERLLAEADRSYVDLLQLDDTGLIQAWWEHSGPADRRALDAGLGPLLARTLRESLRPGQIGWARDNVVRMGPWTFDERRITVPTTLLHGEQDFGSGAEWLAGRIPGVSLQVLPNQGHFVVLSSPEYALDALNL